MSGFCLNVNVYNAETPSGGFSRLSGFCSNVNVYNLLLGLQMLQLLQRWVRELFLKDKEILSFSSIFPKLSSAETIDTSFKGHRGDKLTTKSYYSVGLGMFFFGSDGA